MIGPETTTGTLIDVRIKKPGQIRVGPALAVAVVIIFILSSITLGLGNVRATARWHRRRRRNWWI